MLVIYREEVIDELVVAINGINVSDKIIVYVFSPSEDPWEDSFAEVSDKVELCALPQAIYNAYRRTLPKKRDAKVYVKENSYGNISASVRMVAEPNAPAYNRSDIEKGGEA